MASTHSGDIAPATSAATAPADDHHGNDDMARLKAKDQLIHNAKAATDKEQSMTLMQGIRLYPKAIMWSVLISTCIVMEGYDVCLINNFCVFFHPSQWHFCSRSCLPSTDGPPKDAFPQFNRKYGEMLPNGDWQVTAPWQSGLSNVSSLPSPCFPGLQS